MSRRHINLIVVHCSASGPKTTAKDIKRWHKEKGWSDIGYHLVIESNGLIRHGRDINKTGAHCKGYNAHSVGVCMVGGYDGKTLHKFTDAQFKALKMVLQGIQISYGSMPIKGHYELDQHGKSCPNFNVKEWLDSDKIEYFIEEPKE